MKLKLGAKSEVGKLERDPFQDEEDETIKSKEKETLQTRH